MKRIYGILNIGELVTTLAVVQIKKSTEDILCCERWKSPNTQNKLIMNYHQFAQEINNKIKILSEKVKFNITRIILVFPSENVRIKQVRESIDVDGHQILKKHLSVLSRRINDAPLLPDESLIRVIPHKYTIDNCRVFKQSPLHMYAKKLELETFIYTINSQLFYNHLQVFRHTKLKLANYSLKAFCEAFAFPHREVLRNAIVIDYGRAISTVSYFHDFLLLKTQRLEVGAENIDKDIQYVLREPLSFIEGLKLNFARLWGSQNDEKEIIIQRNISSTRSGTQINFTVSDMQIIVKARVKETITKLMEKAKEYCENLDCPIIIMGGGANIIGLKEFIHENFDNLKITVHPTRLNQPDTNLVIGAARLFNLTTTWNLLDNITVSIDRLSSIRKKLFSNFNVENKASATQKNVN